jgi:hypothetical protein
VTVTDDDKTLVKRLRWSASGKVGAEQARLERNAADRIEAQAAEIERLRGALRDILRGDDPSIPGAIEHIARTALGETE